MGKHNEVETIALAMHDCAKYMPTPADVVPDEVILEQLQQLEDLEQTDRDGRTLLINTAFYGRHSAAAYLLSRGAQVNARDTRGYTALHAAVQKNDLPMITLLLENGADVQAKDIRGKHLLSCADLKTPPEVFRILLQHGADPTLPNDYGITVLDIFAAYPDIVAILRGET